MKSSMKLFNLRFMRTSHIHPSVKVKKMRIDLALLFTWREVARFKNSVNTNLLIMDEVFDSSLDGFGTEEFLKIVKYVIKDANVFVISHKQSLHDRFEDLIQFEKVKGFSRMT